jgi:exodeoxyribonuclease VII large subunit
MTQEADVLTVSEINRQVKDLVETNFPRVWIQGEISNCTRAASGHLYLTLKDDSAQLRAVMWKTRASRLKFDVQDGLEVVAAGPIEIYQARGSYQLIIEQMQPQGVGALELAFRQLQEKLAAEGLFAPERKRPLPRFPRRIALVTSPTSAAVRDMLQVITRRWNAAEIVVVPVPVQGDGAAEQIAAALRLVADIPRVDVVITGRGGGSLEDLWAFNEEVVARAIVECPLPVVSAVGHEIDVTIADLVADRRALTPSEAGELVVPDRAELRSGCTQLGGRMRSALREQAVRARMKVEAIASRTVFTRPLELVHDRTARVDELAERMPRTMSLQIERSRQQLAAFSASLDALSPLNVLGRGYTITLADKKPIRSANQLQTGTEISTLFHDGHVTSQVTEVTTNSPPFGDPTSSCE